MVSSSQLFTVYNWGVLPPFHMDKKLHFFLKDIVKKLHNGSKKSESLITVAIFELLLSYLLYIIIEYTYIGWGLGHIEFKISYYVIIISRIKNQTEVIKRTCYDSNVSVCDIFKCFWLCPKSSVSNFSKYLLLCLIIGFLDIVFNVSKFHLWNSEKVLKGSNVWV